MQNIMFTEVSLTQMRLFLAVAKEQSFTKAAEQMQVEHSAASRKIALLEQELGVKLFIRNRPVQLTEAGKYLYAHWQSIVNQIDSSLLQLQKTYGQCSQRFVVCMGDSGNELVYQVFFRVNTAIKRQYPGLIFQYEILPLAQCYERLDANTVDLFIGPPVCIEGTNRTLSHATVATVPQMVCLHKDNPLSECGALDISDLRSQRFILFTPEWKWNSATMNTFFQACYNAGFKPDVALQVNNAHELILGLQNPDEVFLCDCFFRNVPDKEFRLLRLRGITSRIEAYWHTDSNKRFFINRFLREVQNAFMQFGADAS